jgi:P2 family phage contractile tail tube protein
MIPRVLRNFNVFVNGSGYAGRISEVELPELSIKAEEYRGGGQDGVVSIDLGLEAMSTKLTFGEYDTTALAMFGNMDGNATQLQFRGALQRDGETAIACVCDLHGGFTKSTMGTWKAGDLANLEMEGAIRYYKLTIGDTVVYQIDIDNMIRIINGVDQLASIRSAIGM